MLTYDTILAVAIRVMHEVRAAGYDLRLCVWEFGPDVWNVVVDHHEQNTAQPVLTPVGNEVKYMGIPVRVVADAGMTLLLKQVNLERAQ